MELDVGAMKRTLQEELAEWEKLAETMDDHPLDQPCLQICMHMAQAQLSAWEEMWLHYLDGRVTWRVVKEAMQGLGQVLCERQLDFECNDVIVAAESVEKYIPCVARIREKVISLRSLCERRVSICNIWLTRVAFRTEQEGLSYLHLAVGSGRQEDIMELLRSGFHVDVSANNRRTPLMYAAGFGDLDAIDSLLEFGANIRHVDDGWNTPLHCACILDCLSEKVVDRLWRAGAEERALNRLGETPLDMLMRASSEKEGFGSVRLFLEQAPARRRWGRRYGWIFVIRNRAPAGVVGGGAQVRPRRSARLPEGRLRNALEFLVRPARAPDDVFFKVMSFLWLTSDDE